MSVLDLFHPEIHSTAPWPPTSLVGRLKAVREELDDAPAAYGPALLRRLRLLSAELDDVSALIADLGAPPARPGLVVDPESFTASLDGRPLCLTYREFRLLQALVEHRGRALSRQRLMLLAWDAPSTLDAGTRTIDVHVRRLRVKLGPAGDRVRTVRRVGYRLE